ncbi:hypothetical protein MAE02_43570 [Microvirga aerophila]|uniref:Uncharacterized protein n=1 Tax=Microvirga aerophila TaxID=670291 RepID=A0A512BXI6_9HYPH|nr:hypothetical protein MAE02_43570 [Microvirga aerophila]
MWQSSSVRDNAWVRTSLRSLVRSRCSPAGSLRFVRNTLWEHSDYDLSQPGRDLGASTGQRAALSLGSRGSQSRWTVLHALNRPGTDLPTVQLGLKTCRDGNLHQFGQTVSP